LTHASKDISSFTSHYCKVIQHNRKINEMRYRTALFWVIRPPKRGPISCPETSVRNYHYSLRNNPKERSSHLRSGGSLKSRKVRCYYTVCIPCWFRMNIKFALNHFNSTTVNTIDASFVFHQDADFVNINFTENKPRNL